MKVDIYIEERNGSREIRIPWLPEKIDFQSGGTTMATYDIMDKGEVSVPTGSGLGSWSWEGIFPGKNRTDKSLMRGKWKAPKSYHDILMRWKEKGTPLTLMVTGYPINEDVILEDYKGEMSGGFGDMVYNVSFIEDRDIKIKSTKVAAVVFKTETRSAVKLNTYTIKSGDCLWAIAEKQLGNGTKWPSIYQANKEIIEKTAKKYGHSSSENGWWVFPGTVLTIP